MPSNRTISKSTKLTHLYPKYFIIIQSIFCLFLKTILKENRCLPMLKRFIKTKLLELEKIKNS